MGSRARGRSGVPRQGSGACDGRSGRASRTRRIAPMWAQVAPGNAASLRAFLAAGYLPGRPGGVAGDAPRRAEPSAGGPTRPAASRRPSPSEPSSRHRCGIRAAGRRRSRSVSPVRATWSVPSIVTVRRRRRARAASRACRRRDRRTCGGHRARAPTPTTRRSPGSLRPPSSRARPPLWPRHSIGALDGGAMRHRPRSATSSRSATVTPNASASRQSVPTLGLVRAPSICDDHALADAGSTGELIQRPTATGAQRADLMRDRGRQSLDGVGGARAPARSAGRGRAWCRSTHCPPRSLL